MDPSLTTGRRREKREDNMTQAEVDLWQDVVSVLHRWGRKTPGGKNPLTFQTHSVSISDPEPVFSLILLPPFLF